MIFCLESVHPFGAVVDVVKGCVPLVGGLATRVSNAACIAVRSQSKSFISKL